MRVTNPVSARWATRAMMVAVLACSSPVKVPTPAPVPTTLADASTPEDVEIYRQTGFIVADGSIPFVGIVRYAATEFLDSTAVMIALSVPPRALSFVRAGDRYAAFYSMRVDVLRGDAIVRSERPTGEVRVASFGETRGDEGVIFQRTLKVAPGAYDLRLTAQDSLGSGSGNTMVSITVPALPEGSVAPIVPTFISEPRTNRNAPMSIIANPRATARFGRDSLLEFYVEGYGATAPPSVIVRARRQSDSAVLSADTVRLAGGTVRAGRARLPVSQLDLGPIRVESVVAGGAPVDSLTAIVNLGVDMPVASISELVDAMRYFGTESDLQRLRGASAAARPAAWASLVRRSDPNPATPDNEALLEYARRLRVAERLFARGKTHGWQTDRGAVVAALGEPTYMTEPQPADSLGLAKVVTWEYRRYRLFLVFSNAAGPDNWRLTPLSEENFRALLALSGPCVGCR